MHHHLSITMCSKSKRRREMLELSKLIVMMRKRKILIRLKKQSRRKSQLKLAKLNPQSFVRIA